MSGQIDPIVDELAVIFEHLYTRANGTVTVQDLSTIHEAARSIMRLTVHQRGKTSPDITRYNGGLLERYHQARSDLADMLGLGDIDEAVTP